MHTHGTCKFCNAIVFWNPLHKIELALVQQAQKALTASEQERADMETSVTALAETLEQRLQDMGDQVQAIL